MMKNTKLYQTPELTVILFSQVDVITASDNDAIWNDAWNDQYSGIMI